MFIDIAEVYKRAVVLLSTGNTLESSAKKLSAEFSASAYVSKGKLWASYKNANGVALATVLS